MTTKCSLETWWKNYYSNSKTTHYRISPQTNTPIYSSSSRPPSKSVDVLFPLPTPFSLIPTLTHCSHLPTQVDESRRALDANGLRYLISMRSFYILNHRASAPNSPSPHAEPGAARHAAGWRARLRFRDMIWAFHSESQGLLLTTSVAACEGGKMTWGDARALGVFLWLNGLDAMVSCPSSLILLTL